MIPIVIKNTKVLTVILGIKFRSSGPEVCFLATNLYCFLEEGRGWPEKAIWHPTPVLLPGKSHGWRSLAGCSPWGRKESDMTEQLHFHFSLSCIGEGNANPLQCSCLENPRDRGAWWAAVYGVTQSRTWLKWLSSSSSSLGKMSSPLKVSVSSPVNCSNR